MYVHGVAFNWELYKLVPHAHPAFQIVFETHSNITSNTDKIQGKHFHIPFPTSFTTSSPFPLSFFAFNLNSVSGGNWEHVGLSGPIIRFEGRQFEVWRAYIVTAFGQQVGNLDLYFVKIVEKPAILVSLNVLDSLLGSCCHSWHDMGLNSWSFRKLGYCFRTFAVSEEASCFTFGRWSLLPKPSERLPAALLLLDLFLLTCLDLTCLKTVEHALPNVCIYCLLKLLGPWDCAGSDWQCHVRLLKWLYSKVWFGQVYSWIKSFKIWCHAFSPKGISVCNSSLSVWHASARKALQCRRKPAALLSLFEK